MFPGLDPAQKQPYPLCILSSHPDSHPAGALTLVGLCHMSNQMLLVLSLLAFAVAEMGRERGEVPKPFKGARSTDSLERGPVRGS